MSPVWTLTWVQSDSATTNYSWQLHVVTTVQCTSCWTTNCLTRCINVYVCMLYFSANLSNFIPRVGTGVIEYKPLMTAKPHKYMQNYQKSLSESTTGRPGRVGNFGLGVCTSTNIARFLGDSASDVGLSNLLCALRRRVLGPGGSSTGSRYPDILGLETVLPAGQWVRSIRAILNDIRWLYVEY